LRGLPPGDQLRKSLEDLQGLPRGAALRGLRAEHSHDRHEAIGGAEEGIDKL